MNRIVYINGCFLPESEAKVSIFDRGFLFADAVYEVTPVLLGKPLHVEDHLRRLQRSLKALELENPLKTREWVELHHHLIQVNQLEDGLVYLQVTRGAACDRDFSFPDPGLTSPSTVVFTQNKPGLANHPLAQTGMKIITLEDLRWERCDIKSTQLLYPAMAKHAARGVGADDAWLVKDGYITEGSSNNAFIIKAGKLITRHSDESILSGITRTAILRLAAEAGIPLEERPFSVEETRAADEAFLTSSSTFVMPVVRIDGHPVGNGTPGPLTLRMRELYLNECRLSAVAPRK